MAAARRFHACAVESARECLSENECSQHVIREHFAVLTLSRDFHSLDVEPCEWLNVYQLCVHPWRDYGRRETFMTHRIEGNLHSRS